jgi:Ca-activated chloride channel family protein
MTFLWPDALWLLLALPALAGLYVLLLRRKKAALQYSSLSLVRQAMAPAQYIRRHIPPLLFMLAVSVFIVAIARPATVMNMPSTLRTVILAIDVSLSMAATDVLPSRLAAAQAAAKAFVKEQPRDVQIGIIAFAGEADLVQAPTLNREDALAAIDHLQLGYGTAIGSGIIAALRTIFPDAEIGGKYDIFGMGRSPVAAQPISFNDADSEERGAKPPPGSYPSAAIVLITDGRGTVGPPPTTAARTAAERGVRVYTVGFGTTKSATVETDGQLMEVGFDEAALKEIAETTHGGYFHAASAAELRSIYQNLNGRLVQKKDETELTALFTALAAVLWLTSAALSLMWFNRRTSAGLT